MEPRLVDALLGMEMTSVACGGWHSLVASVDGDTYSWGRNHHGQLGTSEWPVTKNPTFNIGRQMHGVGTSVTSRDCSSKIPTLTSFIT